MAKSGFSWTCPVCSKVVKHKKSVSRHKKIHKDQNELICVKRSLAEKTIISVTFKMCKKEGASL